MNERNFTVTGVLYVYQNKRYCNQSCGNLFLLREGFSEHEVIKYINQQNHACAIRREYDVRWQYADSSQAEVQNKCIRYACCRPTNISCLENLLSFASLQSDLL